MLQKKTIGAFMYNKMNSRLRKEGKKERRMETSPKDSRKAEAEEFLRFSREGPFEEFEKLFLAGADKNAADSAGNTALMYAVKGNQIEIVEYLIREGANVNARTNKGTTPLMFASYYGYEDVVKALISAGADVNLKDKGGHTELMNAAYQGHLDIVKVLVDAGASMIAINNDGETAFSLAKKNNHRDVLKFLRSRIFKDKFLDETLRRLMHPRIPQNVVFIILLQLNYRRIKTLCAIAPFLKDVFSRFIEDVCDGNLFWKEKSKRDFPKEVEEALPFGIVGTGKYSWRDFYERTIDLYESKAISRLEHKAYVKTEPDSEELLFLEKALEIGINPNTRDKKDGSTLLMVAAYYGNFYAVNALIKAGADVDAKNNQGNTALIFAAQEVRLRVMEALIKGGAEVNLTNNDGYTALMLASFNGRAPAVKQLLAVKGIDVNMKNNNGKTALMLASTKESNKRIVNMLKDAGATSSWFFHLFGGEKIEGKKVQTNGKVELFF